MADAGGRVLGGVGLPREGGPTCPDIVDVLLNVLEPRLVQVQAQLQFGIQTVNLGGHHDLSVEGTLVKPLLKVLEEAGSKSAGENSESQPSQQIVTSGRSLQAQTHSASLLFPGFTCISLV